MWNDPDNVRRSGYLLDSYHRWTGDQLLTRRNPELDAQALYKNIFEVVSHGVGEDPIFNYANLSALRLWEADWNAFISMPSRLSAEPDARTQAERSQALKKAEDLGCIFHYKGVRITTKGRRFEIEDATIWTVVDASGKRLGQAALLNHYKFL